MNEGCGDNENVGGEIIVGVEGAFTGVSVNPDADPTGLMLLLALIDKRYWPLHVCGDTGIGAQFNDIRNIGGDVETEEEAIDPIDRPIEAHGCVINCFYSITTDIQAQCIVGKIDGEWNILRVMGTSFTGGVTASHNSCRCCGMTPSNRKLYARILTVTPAFCGEYRACDEFVLKGLDTACDPENPLRITAGCNSTADSELSNPEDWLITVCGVPVQEIISLQCCVPFSECVEFDTTISEEGEVDVENCVCIVESSSESASESLSVSDDLSLNACGSAGRGLCRLEIVVETGPISDCNDCQYTILIYSDPYDIDPCTDMEDVIVDEVEAEACGLDDLSPCDRVIIARVPYHIPGLRGSECGPVEWFVIRACSENDCKDPCEPPPPPNSPCCDILCADLPSVMTATFEVTDCDCVPCGFTIAMPKMDCLPGVERGQWRYDPVETEIKCLNARTYVKFDDIQYFCGADESDSVSGSASDPIEQVATLIVNGMSATLVESSCNPLYSVFEINTLPLCWERFPGELPPLVDLICKVRITITE